MFFKRLNQLSFEFYYGPVSFKLNGDKKCDILFMYYVRLSGCYGSLKVEISSDSINGELLAENKFAECFLRNTIAVHLD